VSDPPAPPDVASHADAPVRALAEFVRLVGRQARRLGDATDAQAVHDVRVACRRCEVALGLWRDLLPRRVGRRARNAVRRLRRALGATRDAEVLAAGIGEAITDHDARLPESERMLAAMLAARLAVRAHRRRVSGAQHGRRTGGRERRLARAVRAAATVPAAACATAIDARAARRAGRARDRITAALEAPDAGTLHAARIAVKGWRYAAEYRVRAGLAGAVEPGLTDLQRALGAALDRARLAARIARVPGLVTLAATLAREAEQRRDRALAAARPFARPALRLRRLPG
jgi:CHAD domain-containing protein